MQHYSSLQFYTYCIWKPVNYNFVSMIQQEEESFYQQTGLKFEEEINKMLHLKHGFLWVLKLGHFGQQIRNTWKVLKCAGEGWRRSVGPIMWEMKKCYLESMNRNILHEIRKRKANWVGHILRRNCLLKQVIEGKIKEEMEVAKRRWRRRRKLLDDPKDRRGYSHLKEEVLDRTMWRHRFGGGFGPVVRQNTEWMNENDI